MLNPVKVSPSSANVRHVWRARTCFELLAYFFDIACQDAARQDFICSNKGLFDSSSVQTLCLPSIEVGTVSRFVSFHSFSDYCMPSSKIAESCARDLRVTNQCHLVTVQCSTEAESTGQSASKNSPRLKVTGCNKKVI